MAVSAIALSRSITIISAFFKKGFNGLLGILSTVGKFVRTPSSLAIEVMS